eukprot:TRINITY_DN8673_c0_g1_i1.p1 TRINITY_DN8673_c0_g1~~TRINITY_DN8673_c0_g1_i1.p1  ORF type:complete len:291 (+),score=95.74 TRINITY_DN8673_c0_g1_i1:3-875(+)
MSAQPEQPESNNFSLNNLINDPVTNHSNGKRLYSSFADSTPDETDIPATKKPRIESENPQFTNQKQDTTSESSKIEETNFIPPETSMTIEVAQQIPDMMMSGLKYIDERERLLQEEMQQLRDGTHIEYQNALKKLEEEKKDKQWMIDQWKQYEIDSVNLRATAQEKQAEEEYQQEQRELKERLIKQCELEQKKLDALITSSNGSSNSTSINAWQAELLFEPSRITRRNLRRGRYNNNNNQNNNNGKDYYYSTDFGIDSEFTAVSELKIQLNDRELKDDLTTILKSMANKC